MIRPNTVLRTPARIGAAAAIAAAGAFALAGCASDAPAAEPVENTADQGAVDDGGDGGAVGEGATGGYADGTYTAEGAYSTPETLEQISVTVTLEGGVITDVEVVGNPQKSESAEHQAEFIGGIAEVVVGKSIDEIQVSRVAGSSLTSGGFNQAIETIKAEAAQ